MKTKETKETEKKKKKTHTKHTLDKKSVCFHQIYLKADGEKIHTCMAGQMSNNSKKPSLSTENQSVYQSKNSVFQNDKPSFSNYWILRVGNLVIRSKN